MPSELDASVRPLPFLGTSTGVETRFTDLLDPGPRSRRVCSFHRPVALTDRIEAAPLVKRTELLSARQEHSRRRGTGSAFEVRFRRRCAAALGRCRLGRKVPPSARTRPMTDTRFRDGFSNSFSDGFSAGFSDSFLDGFSDGFLDGFPDGFLDGFPDGFLDSFSASHRAQHRERGRCRPIAKVFRGCDRSRGGLGCPKSRCPVRGSMRVRKTV